MNELEVAIMAQATVIAKLRAQIDQLVEALKEARGENASPGNVQSGD